MSNVEQEDPFEVLGVTRDVEERELKKRYFGLLREFPPETHPEQFARIQRAWEIVSDPERRAEHLAVSQPYEGVAEPWRTRLREALRLLSNGEVDLGRVQLKTLLEEKPDLNDARELLQQVYFNHEQWAEAEVQLRELIARQPEQTHFLSRLVLVLGRLDRHVDALAVAHQWLEVSQRKDPMAWVYIAETLAAQKRHPEALVAIADGLAAVEAKSPLLLTSWQCPAGLPDHRGAARSRAPRHLSALERQQRRPPVDLGLAVVVDPAAQQDGRQRRLVSHRVRPDHIRTERQLVFGRTQAVGKHVAFDRESRLGEREGVGVARNAFYGVACPGRPASPTCSRCEGITQ